MFRPREGYGGTPGNPVACCASLVPSGAAVQAVVLQWLGLDCRVLAVLQRNEPS
jgi:hypothetical protein